MRNVASEEFIEKKVTYTIELDGKIVVVEHVPARVSLSTGEAFFSPETVERVHAIVRSGGPPVRTISASVFEFAA